MKKLFIIISILLNFSLLHALSQDIVATGMADIRENKIAEARKEAIKDAQRNVVEKGLGVFIKSESEVKDAALVKDQILSKAEGYISEFDIVKEQQEGQTYKVTISAKIAIDKLGDDISKFVKKIKAKMSNPSISFVLTTWEKIGEKGQRERYDTEESRVVTDKKYDRENQRDSYDYTKQRDEEYRDKKYEGEAKYKAKTETGVRAKADISYRGSYNSGSIEGEAKIAEREKAEVSASLKEQYRSSSGSEAESVKQTGLKEKGHNFEDNRQKQEKAQISSYQKIDEKLWKKYPDNTIIDSFQQEFKNKGFDLKATDKAREIALSESLVKTSIDINDRGAVRKFAEKEGANFVARGEVKVLDVNTSNQTGNYNVTSQIGVEIIDVNSGDIVASYSNTAAASAQVAENAKFQSIKKLAILAAKTLAEQTLVTWDERANKGRQYVIEFQSIKNMRKQKKQILDLVQSLAEITHQTGTDTGTLVFTIQFKGSKSDLETQLLSKMENLPGFGENDLDGPFNEDGKIVFKFIK